MEAFLQSQLELAQSMLKDNRLSDSQRINWMGYKDAIQKVRLFQADRPAPAFSAVLYEDEIQEVANDEIGRDLTAAELKDVCHHVKHNYNWDDGVSFLHFRIAIELLKIK